MFKIDQGTIDDALGENLKALLNEKLEEIIEDAGGDIIDKLVFNKLDFNFVLAEYMEVVRANDDGYQIDYGAGIGGGFAVEVTVGAMLPKAGTYDMNDDVPDDMMEMRDVKLAASASAGLAVFLSIELDADGELVSISMDVYLRAEATVKLGFSFELLDDDMIKWSYNESVFSVGFNAAFSLKLSFCPSEEYDDELDISVDKLSITGKVTVSDDLKKLVDMASGEEGVIDSLLNLHVEGLILMENGELKVNDLLEHVDINEMIGGLAVANPGDLRDGLTAISDLDLFDMLMDSPAGEIISTLGLEDFFEGLKSGELTKGELNDIKNALNDIKTGGETKKGLDLLLVLAVVLVLVIVILAAIFIVRSKNKA
ncbi:MAG: hypothetical protein LBH69_02430 [Methanomassiliicoccaceae archaeon]|nr:hypothetical protein [Methanomassiliicoccaceae archaeon]